MYIVEDIRELIVPLRTYSEDSTILGLQKMAIICEVTTHEVITILLLVLDKRHSGDDTIATLQLSWKCLFQFLVSYIRVVSIASLISEANSSCSRASSFSFHCSRVRISRKLSRNLYNSSILLLLSLFFIVLLDMRHIPHERMEDLNRQPILHRRSNRRGDKRGSRFCSPKQKYRLEDSLFFD